MTTFILIGGYVLLQIAALVFALRAIRTSRTSQGAVAWVVFLVALPVIAVPAYLFLGSWRFRGYVVARREVPQIVDAVREISAKHGTDGNRMFGAFEAIAGLPVVGGNDMTLLIDGPQTFDAVFAALDAAQSYVLAQSYIVHDDELGGRFKERLIACARRGVRVLFLFDAVGCHKLPSSYLDELRDAGVEMTNIHAKSGPRNRFQINFRNHRKTIVIDGTTGFIGGHNVGDEYMSRDDFFGNWRDTHCRLTGPVVSQLQLVFAEDWYWATGVNVVTDLNWDTARAEQDMKGVIVATGPADAEEYGTLLFGAMIHAAQSRLWIASPYMVPENDILSALKLAAMRGVDVRIMVPEKVDHWLPWFAAFAYFDELRRAGVTIWRYTNGFLHQKVLLTDDTIAAIGTTNLDNRSCRLNFEAMAVLFDEQAAAEVAQMLENDFQDCYKLDKDLSDQKWTIRQAAPVARLFAPLL